MLHFKQNFALFDECPALATSELLMRTHVCLLPYQDTYWSSLYEAGRQMKCCVCEGGPCCSAIELKRVLNLKRYLGDTFPCNNHLP
jgi:hypothetical protein